QFGMPVRRLYELSRRNKQNGKGDASRDTPPGRPDAGQTGIEKPDKDQADEASGVETNPFSLSPLPEEVQRLIIEYRTGDPGVGFKRIEDRLKSDHLVVVSRKQIRHVLKNHGLLEGHDSSFDRKEEGGKGSRRFEASYAGEMYQMDVSYVYLTGVPVQYLIVIVDDYSRFCVGAELCHDQKADTLIGVLHNACTLHGKPRKLLTDQGSGFYSWSARQTQFQQYLDDQEVEHIVGNPHSPQSQGKVERLIQTIKKECLRRVRFNSFSEAAQGIADFIRGYNFGRPHQGIGGFRPADRFYGVVAERSRIEAELAGREIDFSKGYCIFKVEEHSVSVVSSADGLAVYLDGKLLKEVGDERLH
ncbi:MAG: integrase core domain-containing protein, partial [Phycisphaerales bacterium]